MLGNIGPLEIIVVLIIALIVFGPKRLPELGRSLGRGIREFRGSVSGDHDDDEPPQSRPEIEAGRSAPVAARGAGRTQAVLGPGRPGCPAASGRSPTRIVSASSSTSTSCAAGSIVSAARLRRRPGALLLAEPPAAGNRLRPAAGRSQAAAHLRRHRALHDDADRRRLRRDRPRAAGAALPGVRLRAAGLQRRRAPGRPADHADGARCSSWPASPSPTSSSCRPRSSSCSTSTTASSTSRFEPATTTASSR